jgi:preprotein translocase subunit SecG
MLTLAQIPYWATAILVAIFLFVCVLMVLAVLIQRPAGGGLSGAFGSGAGSGQTAFGAKTGDALTIATIAIFTIYLLFAIGLNFATRPTKVAAGGPALVAPANGTTPAAPAGPTGTPETPPAEPPVVPAPAPTGTATPQPAAPTGSTEPPPTPPSAPTGLAPAPTGGEAPK